MNKILPTIAMMEALYGHTISRKPIRRTMLPTIPDHLQAGNRNKKCLLCGHKNKKCTCKGESK